MTQCDVIVSINVRSSRDFACSNENEYFVIFCTNIREQEGYGDTKLVPTPVQGKQINMYKNTYRYVLHYILYASSF